jgi:hypothetical protein
VGGWPTHGDRGCPTLAPFARVGIRNLSGLGMLVVGVCDFPPIEMHDGWGSLKEVVEEEKGGPTRRSLLVALCRISWGLAKKAQVVVVVSKMLDLAVLCKYDRDSSARDS